MQIMYKHFFAKLMHSAFTCYRLSKKKEILTTESGSKQRFSLFQEKVVIQAMSLNNRLSMLVSKSDFRLEGMTMGI